MRAAKIIASIAFAFVAGVGTGEIIYRSQICRDTIGRCFGRGRLMALIDGNAIYHTDVRAEMAAENYLAGGNLGPDSEHAILQRLTADENLRRASHSETATGRLVIPERDLHREFDLLRDEFADDKLWTTRMAGTGNSVQSVRDRLWENLAGRRLIEQAIAAQLASDDTAVSAYYAEHLVDFAQPVRLRASHIFLAAPPETPAEIVAAKQKLIDSLAARLRDGEDFGALVWEESEDEASKPGGGDLGYFSHWRIPADFFQKISKLKVGETAKPFRSLLGFHIVRVTEIQPARQMTLEEARFEIASRLTNQRRRQAVEAFRARLVGSSALHRSWFWN